MQVGSKLALYKCELVEPPNGQPKFYKATVVEKVYNSKKKLGGNWENAFYNCYIFDLSRELEPAKFDLGKNEKDRYHFDNISNPDKGLFRVVDFMFEKHTKWQCGQQKKDDLNKPIWEDVFYIHKIAEGTKQWRTDDGLYKLLQRKYEAQKIKIAEQKRKNLDKDVSYRKIIREITAENNRLSREVARLEEIIKKQKQSVVDAKISVKEANKQVMVVRRKNTITANELEKAQNKIEIEKQKVIDAKNEVKEFKKMKKKEIISQAKDIADELDDFDFGNI